jgi:hypothetical protein
MRAGHGVRRSNGRITRRSDKGAADGIGAGEQLVDLGQHDIVELDPRHYEPMRRGWRTGELVVRREVLGLDPVGRPTQTPAWHGRPWEALPVYVVEDNDEHLVTYIPPGPEMGFLRWAPSDDPKAFPR